MTGSAKVIGLDFETGGTDPRHHAPVQLGICLCDIDGPEVNVTAQQSWIIAPPAKREHTIQALKVSRITWKQIEAGEDPTKVYELVEEFLADNGEPYPCTRPIVAYNAHFDYGFWRELAMFAGKWVGKWPDRTFQSPASPLIGGWHCGMEISKHLLNLPDYKLDTVAGALGLARETTSHDASEDAILAVKVYARLSHEFQKP